MDIMKDTSGGVDLIELHRKTSRAASVLQELFARESIRTVLLILPPDAHQEIFSIETAQRKRYPNYPPYGLAVIARQILRRGLQVELVNLNDIVLKYFFTPREKYLSFDKVWQDALKVKIENVKPDFIGISCMFTMTHQSLVRVTNFSRQTSGRPVCIGGVHVTNDVNRVMKDVPADLAFTYESDLSFLRFIDVVEGNRPASELSQVVIRDGDQLLQFDNRLAPSPDDISLMPAFELVPGLSEYTQYGSIGAFSQFKREKARLATILANRGCRAQCTFCSVRTFNGSGVRGKAIEVVVDEIAYLKEHCGIEHIMWLDDDLFYDERHTIRLFNELTRRNLGVTWDASNGVIAAACKEEVVAAAADSGCIGLIIGMESGNSKILRDIKKPGTVNSFIRAAEILRRHPQIYSCVFLMLGFPGETLSMMYDTLNVAREMDLDWYKIAILQPLPSTPIYDQMVADGLIEDIGFLDVRLELGAFGKQNELYRQPLMALRPFKEIFANLDPNAVPSREDVDNIWVYMDYHLNYHRLFSLTDSLKVQQQKRMLENIYNVTSFAHPLALYFRGYFARLENDCVLVDVTYERLVKSLGGSEYWRDKFPAFNMSPQHLHDNVFPNRKLPRIRAGSLPVDEPLARSM